MKILQVHNFYRTRGGECSAVLAERELLEQHGHEVIPLYRDSRDIAKDGVLHRMRILADIRYNKAVERETLSLVEHVRPDVAHVHNVFPLLSPSVYVALKKGGVPIVQTVHNFRFLCPNGQFFTRGRICERCQESGFWSAIVKRCMHDSVLVSAAYAASIHGMWGRGVLPDGVGAFIVLNEFFAERLARAGVPQQRMHILGNFVPSIRETVPTKGDYMLYLGRLSPEKGLHTLLNAWSRVGKLPLKIAGTGPLLDELRQRIEAEGLDHVTLLGHVGGGEKQALLEGALAMIAPSEWYENFPISVVESMASGTPVIASRTGGLPEMVEQDHSGILFEPSNAEELAEAIMSIHVREGVALRMAEEALSRARERYGPASHVLGLMSAYSKALEARSIQGAIAGY